MSFDASNRWIASTYPASSGGGQETMFFDGSDRTIGRLRSGQPTGVRYNYGGPSDQPWWTSDEGNVVLERMFGHPGGASSVLKAGGVLNWVFPSIHGDTLVVTDNSGVKIGVTKRYTPEGRPLDAPAVLLLSGSLQPGYLGSFSRFADTSEPGLAIMRMGARPFIPGVQRFGQPDPVEGGAGPSDYAYPADPVNALDPSGEWVLGTCSTVAAVVGFGVRYTQTCEVFDHEGNAGTLETVFDWVAGLEVSLGGSLLYAPNGTIYDLVGSSLCFSFGNSFSTGSFCNYKDLKQHPQISYTYGPSGGPLTKLPFSETVGRFESKLVRTTQPKVYILGKPNAADARYCYINFPRCYPK